MSIDASDGLNTFAAIAERFEGEGHEIEQFEVTLAGDDIGGHLDLSIPILRGESTDDFELAVTDATIEAGRLQVGIDLSVDEATVADAAGTGNAADEDQRRATDEPASGGFANAASADRSEEEPDNTDGPSDADESKDGSGEMASTDDHGAESTATDADVSTDSAAATESRGGDDRRDGESDESAHRSETDRSAAGDDPPGDDDEDSADAASASTATADGSTKTDDRPAYRDPERLAAVYDEDATFAEMTDELGVDVTPQTVRNYMIDHGIHEPDRWSDSDDRNADSRSEDSNTSGSSDCDDGTSVPEEVTPSSEDDSHSPDPEQMTTTQEASDDEGQPIDVNTVGGTDDGDPEGDGSVSDDPDSTSDDASGGTAGAAGDPDTDDPEGSEDASPNSQEAERHHDDPTVEEDRSAVTTADLDDEGVSIDALGPITVHDGVTADELVDAVVGARTVYEVSQRLGLDSDRTRQLLNEYDLIDLVTGRINRDDPPTETDVINRLRTAIDGGDRAQA